MKIRVFSDIHLDVNEGFPFSFKGDEKDTFTLIAGDVSGNVKLTAKWIRQNINNGMFIVGNHDPSYNELGWTIKKQKEYLAERFGEDKPVTFLDESIGVMSKEIPNTNILVIGSTLYTDYQYMDENGKKWIEMGNKGRGKMNEEPLTVEGMNMRYAASGLNDFRWGKVEDENDERGLSQRRVTPKDYKKMFDATFSKMSEMVKLNSNKDIIILTHHCPSTKCIASEYVGNDMNASYISDLEDFIKENPNIKAWCCGHVHNVTNTTIGDKGQILLCNPRGYERDFESDKWSPNTFIDTDTWTVSIEPYVNPKLDFKRKEAHERFLKYASIFI